MDGRRGTFGAGLEGAGRDRGARVTTARGAIDASCPASIAPPGPSREHTHPRPGARSAQGRWRTLAEGDQDEFPCAMCVFQHPTSVLNVLVRILYFRFSQLSPNAVTLY